MQYCCKLARHRSLSNAFMLLISKLKKYWMLKFSVCKDKARSSFLSEMLCIWKQIWCLCFLPSHRRHFLSDSYGLSLTSTWQPSCSLSLVHHLSGTPSTPCHRNVVPPPLQASSICTWEIQSRPLSPSRCVHIGISSNSVVGLAL